MPRADSVLGDYIRHARNRGEVWITLPGPADCPPPLWRCRLVYWPPNGGTKARVEFATGRRRSVDIDDVELILGEVAS